jgi:hypothetical protein
VEVMQSPNADSTVWNRLVLNGEALPGIIQRITASGNLRMDKESVAGIDGVIISSANWTEDTFSVELIIPSAELSRVIEIRKKYTANGAKPQAIAISHPLLKDMGIQKAIFNGLTYDWTVGMGDSLPVTLSFTNITPRRVTGGASNPDGTARPATTTTGIPKSGAITNPPASIKPSDKGTAQSNGVASQPKITELKPPTIPDAARR